MECDWLKTSVGFVPADEDSRAYYGKVPFGRLVRGTFVQPRNPHFHRKFFALLNLAFQHFEETAPRPEYKGSPVQPNFERFRKDVTILAGFHKAVVNVRGDVRLEADSISFGKMDEAEFQQLYDKVLTVLMERVLTGPAWSREAVERTVEKLTEFA